MKFLTILFIAILALCTSPLHATTYLVTSSNDSGLGSLRASIIDANNNPGADTILFSTPMNIELSTPLPQINSGDLVIDGTAVTGYINTPLITVHLIPFGVVFNVNNVQSFTMKGLDIKTNFDGIVIYNNVENAYLYDNHFINNRVAIRSLFGKNITVSGNNFTGSGSHFNFPAVVLSTTDYMLVQNNQWGGSVSGIQVHSSDVTIHDTYDPNLAKQIVIEDDSDFGDYSGYSLKVEQGYTNIEIDDLNLTKASTPISGIGILVANNLPTGSIKITNCDIQNRASAIDINGFNVPNTVDYTITGNNFSGSGIYSTVSIKSNAFTHGHVDMHSNTWGGPNTIHGLFINGSQGLVIGDEHVTNADIIIEDNSGFNNYVATGGFSVGHTLKLNSCNDITIDGLDVSRTGTAGTGIYISGGNNVSINNVKFSESWGGIHVQSSNTTINVTNSSFSNLRNGFVLQGVNPVNISNSNFGCIHEYAVRNMTNNNNTINAQNNYWNHAWGPTNQNGLGETNVGDVDDANFLNTPVTSAPQASANCSNLDISDADADGIDDAVDNCLSFYNPGQADADNDGIGNWCDPDFNCNNDPLFFIAERNGFSTPSGALTSIDQNGNRTFIRAIPNANGVVSKDENTVIVSSWSFGNGSSNIVSYDIPSGQITNIASLPEIPQNMKLDANGDLYVATEITTQSCGGGTSGKIYKIDMQTYNVTTLITGLNRPLDILLINNDTEILIAELNCNKVLKFDLVNGNTSTVFASLPGNVTSLIHDNDGNILVGNGNQVSKIDVSNGNISHIGNTGSSGLTHGLALMGNDHVLATNYFTNSVYKINLNTGNTSVLSNDHANPVFITKAFCQDLDADNDGIADDQDNCPETANPNQTNSDNDEYGDACDEDDDNDGILDTDEINCGSDPLNAASTCEVCDGLDNDLDGTTDEGFVDTDNDGMANCVDTDDDNDGLTDECDSNPLVNNFVFNGIENLPAEWICGNNPNNPKVYICHAPPGNPTNVQTICVSPNAVQAHLNHGCMLGQCIDCATGNGEAIPNSMSLDHTDRVNQIEFTVFPNPASGFLHIQIHNDFSSNIKLEMFDQLGRKVWEKDLEGHYSEHQINLAEENIENGVYILNLHSNEFQDTKRIIVAEQ